MFATLILLIACIEDGDITHILLPTRCVAYTSRKQLEEGHPDCVKIKESTPSDQRKLELFAQFIASHGGHFDPSKAQFAWRKDVHPYYDD
jgi:hypothetical protein